MSNTVGKFSNRNSSASEGKAQSDISQNYHKDSVTTNTDELPDVIYASYDGPDPSSSSTTTPYQNQDNADETCGATFSKSDNKPDVIIAGYEPSADELQKEEKAPTLYERKRKRMNSKRFKWRNH